MTAVPISTIQTKLFALRERFLSLLPARIDDLSRMLENVRDDGTLRDLMRRFHSIAGTAGTYGLDDVSALAAEGEEICTNTRRFDEETRTYLRFLIDSIRRSAGIPSRSIAHVTRLHAKAPAAGAPAPQRVLCVEDDSEQAQYVAAVLRDAGYEVESIGEASQFENTLSAFRPDLIILDIGLPHRGQPHATGLDLARQVRANPAYATVPIVVLTVQRKASMRIQALDAGADDYLTKPVSPDLLRAVAGARLKRSQSVQALIDHDPLTGALTRGGFFRRAEQLVAAAASRKREQVALVMLDLDYFKAINDRYGHIVGDRVLVSFVAYLKLNLRVGDEVGRYGGEEFVMLLCGIGPLDAQILVTRLIDRFAGIAQQALDGTTFHVTFSAGVAMWEPDSDLQTWKQRADEALYSAKHHGRARVEAA